MKGKKKINLSVNIFFLLCCVLTHPTFFLLHVSALTGNKLKMLLFKLKWLPKKKVPFLYHIRYLSASCEENVGFDTLPNLLYNQCRHDYWVHEKEHCVQKNKTKQNPSIMKIDTHVNICLKMKWMVLYMKPTMNTTLSKGGRHFKHRMRKGLNMSK